jgi:hypothetical protein
MDATSLFISPNRAFAGGSESEVLIIRKNAFVATSILAIVVDIAKRLFQVYTIAASRIFLHLLAAGPSRQSRDCPAWPLPKGNRTTLQHHAGSPHEA